MNLVLLPGNSNTHRQWIDAVEEVFAPHFDNVYTQYYDHWFMSGEDLTLDLQSELDKVVTQTENWGKFMIFAKSAGAMIALKGLDDGVLAPETCTFVGFPRQWALDHDMPVDEWMLHYTLPTLFIQQRQDPAMFAENLEHYLIEMQASNYMVSVIEGASHTYSDIEKLFTLTRDFVDFD